MSGVETRLKNTEKVGVFHLVQAAGFSPNEFTWSDQDKYEGTRSNMGGGLNFFASVLTHTSTLYYCRFGGFHTEISPGEIQRVEYKPFDHGHFVLRKLACKQWLAELRKEVDTPDLWEMARQASVLSGTAATESDNEPFSGQEQQDIKSMVGELRELLLSFRQYTTREFGIIATRLNYIEESSQRMGRKDWINIIFGSLVSLAMGLMLPPEQANTLVQTAGTLAASLMSKATTRLLK